MTDYLEALRDARTKGARNTLDAIYALQASLPECLVVPRLSMPYEEQNKYVTWRFDSETFKSLDILHVTDTQVGHLYANIKEIKKYNQWILAEPNRFLVWGGDMIDAAHAGSPGVPWENLCGPSSQVFRFCELMAPVRGRILGYVGGNHERRGMATFGDLGALIATILRLPYSAGQQFINIEYGQESRQIFLWHGRGSAKTAGAKMQLLMWAMRELSGGAHFTLIGHLHDAMTKAATVRMHRDGRIIDRKIFGAMSSSFLEYFGSYAEVAGLSPSDIIMAKIELTPDGRYGVSVR